MRRLYLTDKGAMPPNTRPLWEDPPPPGFHVVQIGEARRLVSDLLTVDEHSGLRYIDAWDAYEWWGWISGRFWEGVIGVGSWGAYKNVKVAVRLILDVDLP